MLTCGLVLSNLAFAIGKIILKIILANFGQDDFTVNSGDRIAQIVISTVTTANFISVNSISETLRGAGGFGSTGV